MLGVATSLTSSTLSNVWIIRVGDGVNFRNSTNHFIWGLTKRWTGFVAKIVPGDLLCFATSKKFGGYIIGIGEFVESYNREDEPLVKIHTKTNFELGWIGRNVNEDWDIQIKYKNLVNTTGKKFMKTLVRSPGTVFNYNKLSTEKHVLPEGDIRQHYQNFLKYGIRY